VKSALAALIQLRLVYHHTSSEGLSTYQANQKNVYPLLRSGRIIQLARETGGPSAEAILRELTLLGYATVQELEAQVVGDGNMEEQNDHSGQVNGHQNNTGSSNPESMDASSFRAGLVHLIDNRYITKLRDAHFQSPFDAAKEIERHLNAFEGSGTTAKSKKAQLDLDERVRQQLAQRLDDITSADVILLELAADEPAFDRQVCFPFQ